MRRRELFLDSLSSNEVRQIRVLVSVSIMSPTQSVSQADGHLTRERFFEKAFRFISIWVVYLCPCYSLNAVTLHFLNIAFTLDTLSLFTGTTEHLAATKRAQFSARQSTCSSSGCSIVHFATFIDLL